MKPLLDIGLPNFYEELTRKLMHTQAFFREMMLVEQRLKETCVTRSELEASFTEKVDFDTLKTSLLA